MTNNKCKGTADGYWEGTFRHELFHTFGITHTNRRKDSGKYIQVKKRNIDPDYTHNFEICPECPIPDEENNPYECNSIMHYDSKAFSVNDKDTIISINEAECPTKALEAKNRFHPTPNDWKVLKNILGCNQR